MGILRSIETGIERVVEGTVGRAFRASVQPVEIARKLAKELEEGKVASVNRTYVPNEFTVYLHPKDRTVFGEYETSLRAELAVYLADHARREGYTLLTRPRVLFETDERLSHGTFGIATALVSPSDQILAGDPPASEPGPESPPIASPLPDLGGLQAGTPLVEPAAGAPDPAMPLPGAAGLPLAGAPLLPLPGPPSFEPEPADQPEPAIEPDPEPVVEPDPEPVVEPEPEPEPELVVEPEPVAEPEPVVEPEPELVVEPEPVLEPVVAPTPPAADTVVHEAPVAEPAILVVNGRRVVLETAVTVIGRAAGCDIVVDDSGSSRRHAEVRRRGQQVVIVDLDSTNGTVVNGRRVREHPLAHGDRIVVGTTTLVFERPA